VGATPQADAASTRGRLSEWGNKLPDAGCADASDEKVNCILMSSTKYRTPEAKTTVNFTAVSGVITAEGAAQPRFPYVLIVRCERRALLCFSWGLERDRQRPLERWTVTLAAPASHFLDRARFVPVAERCSSAISAAIQRTFGSSTSPTLPRPTACTGSGVRLRALFTHMRVAGTARTRASAALWLFGTTRRDASISVPIQGEGTHALTQLIPACAASKHLPSMVGVSWRRSPHATPSSTAPHSRRALLDAACTIS
jgi:hypothetical protein